MSCYLCLQASVPAKFQGTPSRPALRAQIDDAFTNSFHSGPEGAAAGPRPQVRAESGDKIVPWLRISGAYRRRLAHGAVRQELRPRATCPDERA